jgi:hypothetical protein
MTLLGALAPPDDIVQRSRCIVARDGSLLLAWLRLLNSTSARFRAAGLPYLIVRKILYVIPARTISQAPSHPADYSRGFSGGCRSCRRRAQRGAFYLIRLSPRQGLASFLG